MSQAGVPRDDMMGSFGGTERTPSALLHWLRGFIAGLIVAALSTGEQRRERELVRWAGRWRRWVQRLVDSAAAGEPEEDAEALSALRAALIGRTRKELLVVLGPPPATSVPEPGKGKLKGEDAYLRASTWYYPLDLAKRQAIGVTFSSDVATDVDRITGPAV